MRIIAGKYRGKKIKSPITEKTRPTLDRVKEALFSMLIPYLNEAKVLDLFGGTGALGIEAISRGASMAYINDSQKEAISTILYNVQLTNCKNCVKITLKDYQKCLKKIAEENLTFDIIFLDPPYESDFAFNSLKFISDNPYKVLAKEGIIIYELDKKYLSDKLEAFENLECIDTRFYGRVAVKSYKWREI